MQREFRDLTDRPADMYLQVNSCGIQEAAKREFTVLRSQGRRDVHFLYVQRGWIVVDVDGTPQRVSEGRCVVFRPFARQCYSFPHEGGAVTCWIHFTGTAVGEILQSLLRKDCCVYTLRSRPAFEALFHQLVGVHRSGSRSPQEENGILLQLIGLLTECTRDAPGRHRGDVRAAAAYICEHYPQQIDLQKVAERVNLSLSRFTHVFTDAIGVSPYHYLLNLRIARAKELLECSALRVGEIAESVGFSDPLYFSRIFRKYAGVSPRAYRENYLKQTTPNEIQ
ncbi:MAG: helix-turn-helix domain-containing protein [Candidatus Spyradocola sp.]